MKYALFLSFLFALAARPAHAQQPLLDDIAFYADVVMNTTDALHRQRANDSLRYAVQRYLSTDDDPAALQAIPWVSTLTDSLGGWTLVTWQIDLGDDAYRSEGLMRSASGRVMTLHDAWPKGDFDGLTNAKTWYGARYYDVRAFEHDGEPHWLLVGFKVTSKNERQRVAEVMNIDEEGQPTFGTRLLRDSTDGSSVGRVAVVYSPMAQVQMRLDDELQALIYDHVTTLPNGIRAGDGSFQGYRLGSNGWTFVEKFFHTISLSPLSTEPAPTEDAPQNDKKSKRRK